MKRSYYLVAGLAVAAIVVAVSLFSQKEPKAAASGQEVPVVTNVVSEASGYFTVSFSDGTTFPLFYQVEHGIARDGRNAYGPLAWLRPRIESNGAVRTVPLPKGIMSLLANTNVLSIGSLPAPPKAALPAQLPRDSKFADEFRSQLRKLDPGKYGQPMTVYAVRDGNDFIYMTTSIDRLEDGRHRWTLFGHVDPRSGGLSFHCGSCGERLGAPRQFVAPLGGFFKVSRHGHSMAIVPISGDFNQGHPTSAFWEMMEFEEVKKERNLGEGWRLKADEVRVKVAPWQTLTRDLDDFFLNAKDGGLLITRLPYTEFPELSKEENRRRLVAEAEKKASPIQSRGGLRSVPEFYDALEVAAVPGETLLGDPSAVPVHRFNVKGEFVGYDERWRIVADLNFDGTDDMILSCPIEQFGTGGGTWQVFLVSNGVYKCCGEVGGVRSLIIPETCHDDDFANLGGSPSVQIWSVGKAGGGIYFIESNVVVGYELRHRFRIRVISGDGWDTVDSSLLNSVRRHGDGEVEWHEEHSHTESGKVTWSR